MRQNKMAEGMLDGYFLLPVSDEGNEIASGLCNKVHPPVLGPLAASSAGALFQELSSVE